MENKAQASARQNPWFSGRTPFSLRHELSFEHHGCFVSPRVYFFLFRRCSPRHLQAGTTVNDLNGLQLSFFALLRRVAGCSGDCTIPADLLAAEHRAIPVVGSTDTGSTPRYGPTPSLDHTSVASSGGCATIHESFAALSHSDLGSVPVHAPVSAPAPASNASIFSSFTRTVLCAWSTSSPSISMSEETLLAPPSASQTASPSRVLTSLTGCAPSWQPPTPKPPVSPTLLLGPSYAGPATLIWCISVHLRRLCARPPVACRLASVTRPAL